MTNKSATSNLNLIERNKSMKSLNLIYLLFVVFFSSNVSSAIVKVDFNVTFDQRSTTNANGETVFETIASPLKGTFNLMYDTKKVTQEGDTRDDPNYINQAMKNRGHYFFNHLPTNQN